jgi:hypothetical protein
VVPAGSGGGISRFSGSGSGDGSSSGNSESIINNNIY